MGGLQQPPGPAPYQQVPPPPQGYPPQQGYAQQGYPHQSYPQQQGYPPGPPPQGAPQQAPAGEDPVAKLAQFKSMLDQGLITPADYDAAKAKALGL